MLDLHDKDCRRTKVRNNSMCALNDGRGLCTSTVLPKFNVDMLGTLGREAVPRDEMTQHQLMHVIGDIEYSG